METFSGQSMQSTGCHGGSVVHELSDPPPGLTAPALPTACWATSAQAKSRKVPLSPARSGACWAGNVNDNASVVTSVAADFSNEVPFPTFARVQGMFPKIKEEPKHPTLERPTPEWSNASQPTAGRSATVQLHPDRAEMMGVILEAAQRLEAQASAEASALPGLGLVPPSQLPTKSLASRLYHRFALPRIRQTCEFPESSS